MKNDMITVLKNDGIYEHTKRTIIGFASDGASVMTGHRGGLGKLLGDAFGKQLYSIHCAPHKLQLAIGHSYEVDGLKFLKTDIESTVNSIYSFYNRNAVKRKASLRNTAEALNEKLYELNYIFKIRWVSSEYGALERINRNYVVILTNMVAILASPDFANDDDTRNTATALSNRMLNIRFKAIMLFLMDVLNLLKVESLRLQATSGTLIGLEKYRNELLQSIRKLVHENGPALTEFLAKYKCFKEVGRLVRCSTADLDDKTFVLNDQFSLSA
ncbi:MAG: hypothetical protein ACR2M9_01815, partial [Cyanophyceae cyanobacterium]